MKKHVIVQLEYDLGDYSDIEEEGGEIPLKPMLWEDTFYQSDAVLSDMTIVGVRVEEK